MHTYVLVLAMPATAFLEQNKHEKVFMYAFVWTEAYGKKDYLYHTLPLIQGQAGKILSIIAQDHLK